MFFRQVLSCGDNFSYIIADEAIREAAVIDSSYNTKELIRILHPKCFILKYIINTHGHSDHTAGNMPLRSALGGQIVAHKLSSIYADFKVDDGAILKVGNIVVKVLYTPGHTPDSICLLIDNQKLLTGDTLFIGECGRVDLSGGNAEQLYDSLFNKLLFLNDAVEIYPGHDYGPKPSSTIGEQRRTNYVLQPRSVTKFVEFMNQP